jgi:RNA 2',3'-cyclic 3'-phosphodiesterase
VSRVAAFSDTRRLFFALWPRPQIVQRIEEQARRIPLEGRARRVPARNVHLTLAFIGEVPSTRAAAIMDVADRITGARFELELNQIETLPGSNVLCMTTDRTPPTLAALAEELRSGLREQGFRMEDRAFRAHVTLARDMRRRQPVMRIPSLRWQVREFVLVESQRGRAGSEYVIAKRWPLGLAPGAAPIG